MCMAPNTHTTAQEAAAVVVGIVRHEDRHRCGVLRQAASTQKVPSIDYRGGYAKTNGTTPVDMYSALHVAAPPVSCMYIYIRAWASATRPLISTV